MNNRRTQFMNKFKKNMKSKKQYKTNFKLKVQ